MRLSSLYFRQSLAQVTLVAIAYFSSAWLTMSLLGLGTNASPVWPPAGIALAALLFWGERVWVGVFLGDLLMMLIYQTPWGLALSSALGSTLSVMVGARLLGYFQFSPFLARLRDVLALVLLAAMVSPMINATIDIVAQSVAGKLAWRDFWQSWWILWLGDSTGILVITPLLLRLGVGSLEIFKKQPSQRLLEATLCFSVLGIVSWVVFAGKSSTTVAQYPLEYLPFPFVVWAAIRFQAWGAVLSSVLVSILAIAGALRGVGPFIMQTLNLNQAIMLLQTFMAVITITALFLSVTVSERQRAEKQLRTALERDRLLAEVALRIRQSLNLTQIFKTTVIEVRELLQADRVYIAYLKDNRQAQVIAESVVPGYASLLNWIFPEQLLQEIQTLLSQKKVFIAHNTFQANLSSALRHYYQNYQVKAVLTVPLIGNNRALGLLVAHQCSR
ncbi:MAG: MASE1 domain-containing protein, partial [Brasilonema sp.]